jgi:HTH-type transcriptional regulator/antitoxin HipB
LRLADLQGGREPGEALPEAVESSGFRERPAAYRAAIDTVRANLRLPAGQPISTAVAASAVSMPSVDRFPKAEGGNDVASATPIASAHDLGRLVRAERERRRLSQQAFADLVGVGRRFISELENGKATLELGKVLQVASATGIDLLARRRR